MFPSAALFVLFLAGCWLYCLTDTALTPVAEFTGLGKRAWIAIICATFIFGALAWAISRRYRRARYRRLTPSGYLAPVGYDDTNVRWYPGTADAALARHPASGARKAGRPERAVPVGPDDDPEFLRMLDRLISGSSDPE
jgi:hypothetical protein